jgi:hypothetical protein
VETGEEVAIKLEYHEEGHRQLALEARAYSDLEEVGKKVILVSAYFTECDNDLYFNVLMLLEQLDFHACIIMEQKET